MIFIRFYCSIDALRFDFDFDLMFHLQLWSLPLYLLLSLFSSIDECDASIGYFILFLRFFSSTIFFHRFLVLILMSLISKPVCKHFTPFNLFSLLKEKAFRNTQNYFFWICLTINITNLLDFSSLFFSLSLLNGTHWTKQTFFGWNACFLWTDHFPINRHLIKNDGNSPAQRVYSIYALAIDMRCFVKKSSLCSFSVRQRIAINYHLSSVLHCLLATTVQHH